MEEDANPVVVRLKELGLTDETTEQIIEMGIESIEDLTTLREEDFIEVGVPRIRARKIIAALTPAKTENTMVSAVSFETILPPIPGDSVWLSDLKAGGVLKVTPATVISAIRAALAYRVRLFDVPTILAEQMERFADSNEEQVPPEFYELRKQLTRRSYAEIFQAIPGLDGAFVTEVRKKQLFQRIDSYLYPAIVEFRRQLDAWQTTWIQGAANPTMMVTILAAGGGTLPPGMMQPPDTGSLRDAAEEVVNAINKVFAGTGVPVTNAVAYDATKIREVLANPSLPGMIGAANRDQMLRQLNVVVPATYPRLEQNLTRFVLAIMQIKDLPVGEEEIRFFSALYMLGSQIPWDQLDARGPTGIGGKRL